MVERRKLGIRELILLNFGGFGITHGFSIQFARMSSIYEKLGATPDQIPFLWLAAPLTGLIIQPIIGYMSDRTWSRFGRRKPYFTIGAILATIALFIMPHSGSVWMAAGMLWMLDASLNITMEPYRAFIAEIVPPKQLATAYSVNTIITGVAGAVGYWVASFDWVGAFPFLKVITTDSVVMQFYISAIILFGAILVTVLTVKEYPPENLEEIKAEKAKLKGMFDHVIAFFKEFWGALKDMSAPVRRLALVQFFTWMGLFAMWIFYSVAVARYVFGATDPHSALYEEGIRIASRSMMAYQVVATIFAFFIPWLVKKIKSVGVHTLGLLSGGIALLSLYYVKNPNYLYLVMVGVGIAWGSILTMPYKMLIDNVSAKRYGIYTGIFNFFIVIPEILSSLFLGEIMKKYLHNNHMYAVLLGGGFMIIAAIILQTMWKYFKNEEA